MNIIIIIIIIIIILLLLSLSLKVCLSSSNREFKKTTTATSCRTPPNNSVNEKKNDAHAKYNLVGFSTVLCKTTTSNEHCPSFIENVVVRH